MAETETRTGENAQKKIQKDAQRKLWLLQKLVQMNERKTRKKERPAGEKKSIVIDGKEHMIRCYPCGREHAPVYFDIHGGGWVWGYMEESDRILRRMSRELGIDCYAIDYPLVPQMVYPDSLFWVYDTIAWLYRHADDFGFDSSWMAVGGRSAGGTMAAALCILAKQRGEFQFSCQVLDYPAADLGGGLIPDEERFTDDKEALPISLLHLLADAYATKDQQRESTCFPGWASEEELTGLPPAVIQTCERDSVQVDGAYYEKKLREAGVPVVSQCFPGVLHGFDAMGGPEEAEGITFLIRGMRQFLPPEKAAGADCASVEEDPYESEITGDSRIKDLENMPEMRGLAPYAVYGHVPMVEVIRRVKFGAMDAAGWNSESIVCGLRHLRRKVHRERCFYPVYMGEQCGDDRRKKDVNLLYFSADVPNADRPYFVLCAGGGYETVCSMAEAYPAAARLNELGYAAFVLNYRVGENGLMPKPLEDLAAAVSFVDSHAADLHVSAGCYAVMGFSAGAHLAAMWGTEDHGYAYYGCKKPLALCLAYAPISFSLFGGRKETEKFVRIMLGRRHTALQEERCSVENHVTEGYPPSYLVCCRDDPVVRPENSRLLKKKLKELGIPAVLEEGEKGGHGFGDGRGTDVAGWIDRAIAFCENL